MQRKQQFRWFLKLIDVLLVQWPWLSIAEAQNGTHASDDQEAARKYPFLSEKKNQLLHFFGYFFLF